MGLNSGVWGLLMPHGTLMAMQAEQPSLRASGPLARDFSEVASLFPLGVSCLTQSHRSHAVWTQGLDDERHPHHEAAS
jgi:hypothetical protein